jgi:CBS-domain-containing membrane protein
MPVESVMARPVVVCAPDELVSEAEARMAQAQVRRLPVVTALGRLVGILSLNDIAVEAERNRLIRVTDVGLDEVGLTLGLVSHHRLVQ